MKSRAVAISLLLILSIVSLAGCRPDEGRLPSIHGAKVADLPPSIPVRSPTTSHAPQPAIGETPTADLTSGVWIGQSLYEPESPLRFRVEFEPDEWSLSRDGTVGVLTHQSLEGCEIRSTAGRGLGPDWTALNNPIRIGEVDFEKIQALYLGQLEFVSLYAGSDSNYYTGFQVGMEKVSLECMDRSYEVLSTFQVINP
jgi:hypothetical protein